MPIEVLPESTSRAIGSTLVLGDARSVVKELLDNALDAQATSINIEISANTLDVIQVRDNGSGIAAQDRPLLCKRGCTSKIRSLHDLSRLGGTFLGFRGEALASIAELSKAVTLTTRVHGETVGTSLEFDCSGIPSSSSASHPLGTTFRVQHFLQKIPVRRQTALKHAARTLQSIKALLTTYAFARPRVRFSFKVLKAKSDQANWTYAPGAQDTLVDTASKLVGKDTASNCTIDSAKGGVDLEDGWELDALLLSPGTDCSKSRISGSYISIDGRPIASNRTTIKEVVKIYKKYYQATTTTSTNLSSSKPFICLQIKCPPESYDVNIEPAKDEVLFFHPSHLLSLAETLFQNVYGRLQDQGIGFEDSSQISLDPSAVPIGHTEPSVAVPLALPRQTPIFEISRTPEADSPVGHGVMSNPFTAAAMNDRVAQHQTSSSLSRNRLSEDSSHEAGRLPTTQRPSVNEIQPPQPSQLPSPTPSPIFESRYQNPGPPMRRRIRDASDIEPQDHDSPPQHPASQSSPRRTVLQAWLTPQTQSRHDSGPRSTRMPNEILHLGERQKPFRIPFKASSAGGSQGFSIARTAISPSDSSQLINEMPSSGSTSDQSEPSQRRLSLPLTQRAVQNNTELEEIMDFEHRKKAAIAYHRRTALGRPPKPIADVLGIARGGAGPRNATSPEQASSSQRIDLTSADQDAFNSRFSQPQRLSSDSPQTRSRADREFLHAHTPIDMGSPMLTPRSESVGQDSGHPSTAESPSSASSSFLSTNDPRAYLIRSRQRSTTNKPYRTKSSQLPLETTPHEWSTLSLAYAVELDGGINSIKALVQRLAMVDKYASQGSNTYVEYQDLDKVQDCEERVREMIMAQYHSQDGGDMRTLSKNLAISLTTIRD